MTIPAPCIWIPIVNINDGATHTPDHAHFNLLNVTGAGAKKAGGSPLPGPCP